MKLLPTLLRLVFKTALLAFAALATFSLLADAENVRTDIDREAFTGCTLLITIVAWRVLLWMLFRRPKANDDASAVVA